jgi:DNA-binding transcriptional regulator/RsmH inhibitor MraZ
LLEHAGLKDEVVFIGLVNWVEVWDKTKWEERLNYLKAHGEEIAQEINKMKSEKNG